MAGRYEFSLPNGNKFFIRRYDAFLGAKIFGDVQRQLVGPLSMVLQVANDSSLGDIQLEKMRDAITELSHHLDGDTLVSIIKKIINPEYISVQMGGEPAERLDEGMLNRSTDNMADLLTIVWEVLRYNYEEVFTRGAILIGQVQERRAVH